MTALVTVFMIGPMRVGKQLEERKDPLTRTGRKIYGNFIVEIRGPLPELAEKEKVVNERCVEGMEKTRRGVPWVFICGERDR